MSTARFLTKKPSGTRAALIAITAAFLPGTLLAQTTFTTTDAAVAIPDNSAGAFTACQTIVVPAGAGTISDLNIRTAITHSWVGDLTIRLQSPGAASTLMLMNRPGRIPPAASAGNSANLAAATPLTFDDAAPSGRLASTAGEQPVGTACGSTATVGVDPCGPDNFIPAPVPAQTPIAGLGTNLAQFNGTAASGTWTLCVADSAALDTGTLTSWSMVVTTTGGGATPPQFGFTPAPGGSMMATGGTTVGSTGNLSIAVAVATAGSGTGTAATTTTTCTAPTAPFAGFGQTVTAVGTGAITGGPLAGTCTLGAAAATQTLTCVENRGGTPTTRTWTLSCPAGTAPPVATVAVNATSTWSLIALMLALFGFAAVAVRRQG